MYGRYERGYVIPPAETVEVMAIAYGGDVEEWLEVAGYELPQEKAPEGVREVSGSRPVLPSDASLPVAGALRGGAMTDVAEETGEYFPALEEHAALADYVVRVEGHSMSPLLMPGDFAAVRKVSTARPGDLVIARREEETYVKWYMGRSGGLIRLESENPAYEPTEASDIEIIGVVVWSHRPEQGLKKTRG